MTHHFVMTSSLLTKILKIDKFGDFSCDIDYNSRTDHSILYTKAIALYSKSGPWMAITIGFQNIMYCYTAFHYYSKVL